MVNLDDTTNMRKGIHITDQIWISTGLGRKFILGLRRSLVGRQMFKESKVDSNSRCGESRGLDTDKYIALGERKKRQSYV